MNDNDNLITKLTDIEDNGSGLTAIRMTDEELEELTLEKPHYSDDENIQKKFEFAVKMTGFGNVLSSLCNSLLDFQLKAFIEQYFEDNNC